MQNPNARHRDAAPSPESYRIELIGFSAIERTVFVSTFALSQRRRMRYTQALGGASPSHLLLVDSDDPEALAALNGHPLRDVVPTVLIGEGGNDMMGWRLARPVKWMALFDVLDEAMDRPVEGEVASRSLAANAPLALVVTGSSELARMLEAHLTNAGCRVTRVENGENAICKLASEPFACVVVDVALPGIGGLEVARLAKTRSGQRVIVLGASGTPLERMRASIAGVDAYLAPPLDGQLLVAAIDRSLGQRIDR
ncbi:hypothetical protein BH09PSE6_BH09PSE6_14100 [soil metagenome]